MGKHVLLEEYKALKEQYPTAEDSFMWWESNASRPELGVYQVNSDLNKLSLRSYDDTPSTAIYENLTYVDFGGEGTAQDPVARVMEVSGLKFNDALRLILSWEGIAPEEFKPKNTVGSNQKEVKSAFSNNYLREVIKNRQLMKDRYSALAPDLFRTCSKEEQAEGEKLFSIGFVPSNEYQPEDRIFIPEFDTQSMAWGSYRYNRSVKGKKGLLRKNSKRVLFGSHLIKKYKEHIIYSEGHTDTVVNVSKHLATVTTGSSTKKMGENISVLAGKHLHDFPDLDIAGMIGALNRGLEIDKWNEEHKTERDLQIKHTVYWWAEWFYDEKVTEKIQNNAVAKSELFYFIKDQIPIKKGKAFFNLDILALLQAEYARKKRIEIPDRLRIHSWKMVGRGSKPGGYDFIDFHSENNSSKNYAKFISKFKF